MNLIPMPWVLEKILRRNGELPTALIQEELEFLTGQTFFRQQVHRGLLDLEASGKIKGYRKKGYWRLKFWRYTERE